MVACPFWFCSCRANPDIVIVVVLVVLAVAGPTSATEHTKSSVTDRCVSSMKGHSHL